MIDGFSGDRLVPEKHIMFRFASVGAVATLVHVLVYAIGIFLVQFHPQLANACGYAVALVISWLGQRNWTFSHAKGTDGLKPKARFLFTNFLGYCLNAVWVWSVVVILRLPEYYALFGIAIFTPILIFLLMRCWVFVPDDKRS